MNKKSSKSKPRKIDWDKVSEALRQKCNKLTAEQRRRYRDEALRIFYRANAASHISRS